MVALFMPAYHADMKREKNMRTDAKRYLIPKKNEKNYDRDTKYMMDDFFKFWNELPKDGGFSLFDKTHIAWLAVLFAAIFLAARICKKANPQTQERMLKLCATATLCLEAAKDVYLICIGHMNISYLPLEMCGLAIFIELLYVFTKRQALGEIMCVICMPGACAALLFPDWTDYPFFNFMHINSFLLHGLLVAAPVMALAAGWHAPSIRRACQAAIFLCVTVPVIYAIDRLSDCNFMFLLYPSAGSPFQSVYTSHGTAVYLITYAATVVICISLIYAGFHAAYFARAHFHLSQNYGIPKK